MLEFSWVFYRIRIILRIFQMMKFLAGQIPRSCIAFHWWFPIELAGEIIRWVCIKIGYRDHRGWINTKIGAKSGPQDCKFWPIPKIYLIPKPIFCCMLRHFAPFAAWHFFDPKTQSAHLVQLQTLALRPSQIAKQLVTQLQGALGHFLGILWTANGWWHPPFFHENGWEIHGNMFVIVIIVVITINIIIIIVIVIEIGIGIGTLRTD